MPVPTRFAGDALDLGPRFVHTASVAASPAASSETTIATLTVSKDVQLGVGAVLIGYAAYLVGASGSAVNLRIRRTDTSGTIIKASGAQTVTAADLRGDTIIGVDTGGSTVGQVYVLTMTVTAGAAESTVSAVSFAALLI